MRINQKFDILQLLSSFLSITLALLHPKQHYMKNRIVLNTLFFAFLFSISACKKDPAVTTISLQNNTPTTITVTLNNRTLSIPPSLVGNFTGDANTGISGQAITSGGTTAQPVGAILTWDLSPYYFPASGTTVIPIDVSTDYFFLTLKNTSSLSTKLIEVNYGTTAATAENVTVPNDGNTYNIGYYKAFSNSNARFTLTDNTYYQVPALNLFMSPDQVYAAWIQ